MRPDRKNRSIMNRNLQYLFLCITLLCLGIGGAAAQVSHVSTVNPNETREYPYEAYHNKVEGRVFCTFIINPDGRVSDISIVRGASNDQLNREAVRVISVMPKWEAGKINHKAVPVRCYLPIAFML